MTKLINKIKLFLPNGLEKSNTPENQDSAFLVKYGNLNIGKLELKNGEWYFSYCDEFKSQDDLEPLADFPNITKVYKSNELWPFFLVRIPSLQQPKVQDIIEEEHIDSSNQAELLKFFGKKTISDPFELIVC